MSVCEQTRVRAAVIDCFSDPGLRRLRCCTVLHRSEFMPFNCGLSNAKISTSAMKNIGFGPEKAVSVELYLKPNQT